MTITKHRYIVLSVANGLYSVAYRIYDRIEDRPVTQRFIAKHKPALIQQCKEMNAAWVESLTEVEDDTVDRARQEALNREDADRAQRELDDARADSWGLGFDPDDPRSPAEIREEEQS